MSNKKYYKRIKRNQSSNLNNPITWKNNDGSFTVGIAIPRFLMNETETLQLLHMAGYVAGYMEHERITSVEQWDKLVDNKDFKIKTTYRILNDYGKTCCKHLNIDMIEYAPILLENVEELMNHKRSWFDNFITPKTHLKYEWLPILHALVCNINSNVKYFAPDYLNEYHKRIA